MAKDLKTLALARLSGFRHKTVKVPEWRNVSVVLREPSAEAWYLWQEVLNGDGEDDDTLSVVAKTRRNLEADVTLFCDVLCDTDLQRVFTPDDREQVLAVYGPVRMDSDYSWLTSTAINRKENYSTLYTETYRDSLFIVQVHRSDNIL